MKPSFAGRRAAFTLIELVAVIALMLILASISVAVVNSGAIDSQRTVQSADRISGWLLTAKNRAARERTPRGVRFYRNTDPLLVSDAQEAAAVSNPNWFVAECQYVDGTGGQYIRTNTGPTFDPNGARLIVRRMVDNGNNTPPFSPHGPDVRLFVAIPPVPDAATAATNFDNLYIKAGFMLYSDLLPPLRLAAAPYDPNTPPTGYGPYNTTINPIPTEPAGFVFRELLIQDTTTTAVSPSLVSLRESLAAGYSKYDTASNPTERHSTLQTFNFAFKPEPMPLFGEPVMQTGSNVCLDVRPVPLPPPLQAFHTSMGIPLDAVAMSKGYFDIIFAPSGEVIGGTGNIIALWVRDPKKGNGPTDYANAGEQVLIAIYARTGAVATHPVNTDGTDPFKFVRDGVNSGF